MDQNQHPARKEAVSLLTHYMAMLAERTGWNLSDDSRKEIATIVDKIIEAARAPVPKVEMAEPDRIVDNSSLWQIQHVAFNLKDLGYNADFEHPGYIAIETSYGVQYHWGTANEVWMADAFRLDGLTVGQADHLEEGNQFRRSGFDNTLITDVPSDSEAINWIVQSIHLAMEKDARCPCGAMRPCAHIDPPAAP